jgi:hypothetical protein
MSRVEENGRLPFRHELKYVISNIEKERLRMRLQGLLHQDENALPAGFYRIRSLYFDDYWNAAYEDKLMGVNYRYKYRIRIYKNSGGDIFLEKKIKQGNYIAKESAQLTRSGVERILQGDYGFLLHDGQKLCLDFYQACMTGLERPRVMIDYEREPYVCPAGDVRITFDMNVRAGFWDCNLFDDALPTFDLMDPGLLILEVKFTELLPDYIRQALPVSSSANVAVSKFVLGCDKIYYAAR